MALFLLRYLATEIIGNEDPEVLPVTLPDSYHIWKGEQTHIRDTGVCIYAIPPPPPISLFTHTHNMCMYIRMYILAIN